MLVLRGARNPSGQRSDWVIAQAMVVNAMTTRVPLATAMMMYATGAAMAARGLSSTARRVMILVIESLTPSRWGMALKHLTDAHTRVACVRWIAGAGLAGVVVAGGPLVQAHTASDDDAHAWRLRAKASLTVTPDAGPTPTLITPSGDTGLQRVRATAQARHASYAASNALSWSPFHRSSPTNFEDAQRQMDAHECLSRAVYYEARAESGVGQYAVAEVVLNRVRHQNYPNNVCDVVYEGSHRATGCQFTFTCDGSERRDPRGRAWVRAQTIAAFALMGDTEPVTGAATHYHADYVSPYWAPTLVHTETIGAHIFYRIPSSGRG